MNDSPTLANTPHAVPPVIKPRPVERANALIGAALQLKPRGRVLLALRLGWGALIVLVLAVFLLSIPARYNQLVILSAENGISLHDMGLDANIVVLVLALSDALTFLVYTLVGMLIFLRKGKEWIGLFSSLALISAAVTIVRPGDSLVFVDAAVRVPLLLVFTISIVTILSFIFIFPDGHFVPGWARWIVYALVAFAIYDQFVRPLLTQPMVWPPQPTSSVILFGILLGALVQVFRYRRISDPTQKQQTKWVVYGVSVSAVGLITFLIVVPSVFPVVMLPGTPQILYILIGVPLFYIALWQFPLSLAFSILRYRLWEIDFILSRTLVYILLTGILAGLFAALEKIMQDFFVAVTGQGSDIATIIATLIVVAAFTPLKDLLATVVEKRFKNAADPTAKLKVFGEHVQARVTPIHPVQIARRLLVEMTTAYGARGGAAFITQNGDLKLVQTYGDYDGIAALCIQIESEKDAQNFGMIALDDRTNGTQYTQRDQTALDELAQLVARALEEDQAAAALPSL